MRFAEPIGMKALQMNRRCRRSGQETWNDLLVEHAAQFARHAGGEEKARLANIERKAAGRADRIVDHLGTLDGNIACFLVVRRHDPAAPLEEGSP